MIREFHPDFKSSVVLSASYSHELADPTLRKIVPSSQLPTISTTTYQTYALAEFVREFLRRQRNVSRITNLDIRMARIGDPSLFVRNAFASHSQLASQILRDWIRLAEERDLPTIRTRIRAVLKPVPEFGQGDFSDSADATTYNRVGQGVTDIIDSFPDLDIIGLLHEEACFKGYSSMADIFRRLGRGGTGA